MQISCKGSVDTRSSGVDTMLQTQDKIMQNWSSSVDTRSGSVDTRELPRTPSRLFWESVSTLDQLVSTLVALPEKTYVKCNQKRRIMQRFTFPSYNSLTNDI
ncbi:hypothetical protein Taro_026481 [Colocasia esculenta]|uniref:Uncharacterized protein n=1 Tax=Colocasia esculenta TaxID=4460 RepID=A0A843V699_COLES|nr:hypothetical protein [Colocasia esculenta]